MAPFAFGKSRAVGKIAFTGTNLQQIAYLYRVYYNFTLNPLIYSQGAALAAALLPALNTIAQILSQPKDAATRANIVRINTFLRYFISMTTAYINSVARGNLQILHLSTAMLAKEVKNKSGLSAVTNLRQFISPQVTTGDIKINWNKPQGTKTRKGISYTIEILPQPVSVNPRVIGITNKTFFTFTSSTYGPSPHRIRVTPVGGAHSPWLTVAAQF